MKRNKKSCFIFLLNIVVFLMAVGGLLFLSGCFGGKSDDNSSIVDKPSTSDKENKTIEIKGITYIYKQTISPTCVKGGYDIYEDIDNIHPRIYRNEKEALGHDYDENNPHCEWVEANDILYANVSLKCNRCGYMMGGIIIC